MSSFFRAVTLVALAATLGCPTAADDDVPDPMEVAGSYVMVGQQLETDCTGPEWDFWEIFDFMERTANDVPSMSVEIGQSGGALSATQQPSACEWAGSVGADGTFSLRGPCHTATMDRQISITGAIALYGSNFDLDGTMVIEVDRDDGAGGDPDGAVDCTVSAVEVTGSGAPPSDGT